MTKFEEMTDSEIDAWLDIVKKLAETHSNCNSRHIGCIIIDNNGYIISEGANVTGNIYCEFNGCFKRKMGDTVGHSHHCDASHAEETASKLLLMKLDENPEIEDEKPFTAIMNCGYPCRFCLQELEDAGVTNIVITSDTFYTDEDKEAWENHFAAEITARIYHDGDEESARHTTCGTP